MPADRILITRQPLNLAEIIDSIEHPAGPKASPDEEAGALVTFSGKVRAGEEGRRITHLDYEHYEGMAEKEIEKLLAEARTRWPLRAVAIHHRVGPVAVGEASVVVAVATGHRAEAFAAARFLIDELKNRVPIWKAAPPA